MQNISVRVSLENEHPFSDCLVGQFKIGRRTWALKVGRKYPEVVWHVNHIIKCQGLY